MLVDAYFEHCQVYGVGRASHACMRACRLENGILKCSAAKGERFNQSIISYCNVHYESSHLDQVKHMFDKEVRTRPTSPNFSAVSQ